MREADVAVLLALANGLDQRHGTDDVKVQAWFALFQQEAPRMSGKWAQDEVKRHYARTDAMLMPAALVQKWREREQAQAQEQASTVSGDAHCGRTGCDCTHSGPCYKGWLDAPDAASTSPCEVCRPSLAAALRAAGPHPWSSAAADRVRLRYKIGAED